MKTSADSVGRKKLIAICGSTGTGKSQLAVEIAQHLRNNDRHSIGSEIISADSMQMYRGLDVINNKATKEEMMDVPHHLLSILDPEKGEECDVGTFIQKANQIINKLHNHSNFEHIPIVVGGTNYYIQHLILPGNLVSINERQERFGSSDSESENERKSEKGTTTEETIDQVAISRNVKLDQDQRQLFLQFANESDTKDSKLSALQLWKLLDLFDPKMASRLHYRDFRKIRRSLRVLLETGKIQSEWYEEQRKQDRIENEQGKDDGIDRIVFWIYSDLTQLRERLRMRVGKMIERGLLSEIVQLRSIARSLEKKEKAAIDYTRGIFQSIGYKEFDEYLTYHEQKQNSFDDKLNASRLQNGESDRESERLFNQAIEAMNLATRQYAKRQISWLRNRLAPEIVRKKNKNVQLIILDATDTGKWAQNVRKPAIEIVDGEF